MSHPELVIFDCDGVLVDSETISIRVTAQALREAGLAIAPHEVARRFLGLSMSSMMAIVEAELGRKLAPGFAAMLVARVLEAFERELQPVAGVAAAVAALPCKSCVASSSAPERLRRALEIAGLAPLFGPNVFSAAMVARGKPEPDLFLHAARVMGVAPQRCLVVEDSVPGIVAAGRAGMRAFGFCGGSHLRGMDAEAAQRAAGATLAFRSMAELPGLLAGM